MRIGDREIGVDFPPYVIAEIGVNHDGEVTRALELTDAAADAGADAVKLQFFETDRLMSKAAKLAVYQRNAGETDPIEMLRRLELTIDEMELVVDRAHERGIHAIVTVFSTELVEIAETLAWDAYKSASPDIVNKPLLEAMARTGKPMIVSTGASTLDEIVQAVGWLDNARDRLAVLQCVSCYPAPDSALGGITAIADATGLVVGYSDHTAELETGQMACVWGARVLEKHITYDRLAPGPDHQASLIASLELRRYIELSCAHTILSEAFCVATGHSKGVSTDNVAGYLSAMNMAEQTATQKRVLDCERDVREVSRQSVVSVESISAGTTITRGMLAIKRPGTGILAYRLDEVVGRTAARDIDGDVPIVEEDLQ